MNIEPTIPLLEDIFSEWKAVIGADYAGYRNHVYRMLHFCFALHPCSAEERDKLMIAAAFHDIGIWSDGTVDYLPPSLVQVRRYLERTGRSAWAAEIEAMIDLHHKFRAVREPRWPLVEVFRRGDLVDFSLGAVKFGLPAVLVRRVKAQFPNAGFHKRLAQLAGGWFRRHPMSPPPFMKW